MTEALNPDGLLGSVRRLIVCSPVPIAFLSPKMTKSMSRSVPDFEGLWGAFEDELARFLESLREWKAAVAGRELVIVAGDVHLGLQSDITCDGHHFCLQLTSSAIHNERLGGFAVSAFEAISAGEWGGTEVLCKDRWGFSHLTCKESNNYGIVHINDSDGMLIKSIIDMGFDQLPQEVGMQSNTKGVGSAVVRQVAGCCVSARDCGSICGI